MYVYVVIGTEYNLGQKYYYFVGSLPVFDELSEHPCDVHL